jgi:hypothetical protein
MDVLGGWMAGGSLVAILVAVHVLGVDERARARELVEAAARRAEGTRRVAVPRRPVIPAGAPAASQGTATPPTRPVEG